MKTPNTISLILAVTTLVTLGLMASSVDAGLLVEEEFEYEFVPADGDSGVLVNGLNGGTGFDAPWVATKSHGRDLKVGLWDYANGRGTTLNEDRGLSFSTLPVAGSAMSRYGTMGRTQAYRLLSPGAQAALTQDNTTIWFSVLVSTPASYPGEHFLFGSEPLIHTNLGQIAAPGQGFGFYSAETVDAIVFNGSQDKAAQVTGTYTQTLQPDGTHYDPSLIVGKINWKPNGTPDEFFLFSVTDLSSEPSESEAIASITDQDLDQSTFDTVSYSDGSFGIVDEIRFGTSFGSVVGIPDPNAPFVDAGPDMVSWSGEPVQLDPNIVEQPGSDWTNLTYLWSAEPADGVVFDPSAEVEAPAVTITKATENPSVVTLTLTVNNEGNPPEDAVIGAMTIDLYDDACIAALDLGLTELNASDIDGNCITDLSDFALLASSWLDDFTLTEPVPK